MSRAIPGSVHPLSAYENGDGLRPQDLRAAYFAGVAPEAPASEPQTIALVDAYNDPTIEADLATYDSEFGLPACTAANGCFAVVNQKGESGPLPFPASKSELESARKSSNKAKREEAEEAGGWAVEISTDVETARAICHANCHILLVEANTPSYPNLEAAEETAVKHGATEISNSWGGEEPASDAPAFNHAGIVITASSGDEGYRNWTEAAEAGEGNYYAGADYPASSPHVVAVGGTKLTLEGGVRQSETVWNEDPDDKGQNHGAGGGGCSELFAAPAWQTKVPDWSSVGCGASRAVADVAADADPYTGVAVYDSTPDEAGGVLHWIPIGGTSVASPIIASMFALGGGAHEVAYPAQTLYSHLGDSMLYDVTHGGNGECRDEYSPCATAGDPLLDCGAGSLICNAFTGYDGPTGVGAPNGIGAFEPEKAPVESKEEKEAKEKEEEPVGKPGKEETKPEEPAEKPPKEEIKAKEEPPAEESKSEEPGSKGGEELGGGGLKGSEGGTGSGSGGTSPPTGGGSGSTPSGPPATLSSSITPRPLLVAHISSFTLTALAQRALRHARLGFADVAFAFKISAATSLRVTLALRVGPIVPGMHGRWQTVPAAMTFTARRGLNRRRLPVPHALAPGLYRLTLTPRTGPARSLVFRVP